MDPTNITSIMSIPRSTARVSCIVAVVWATVGCGGTRGPATAVVSGRVTLGGEPVEGVEVRFMGPGMNGVGMTGEDGCFKLERGAAVGENRVCLRKYVGDLPPGLDAGQLEAMVAAQGGRQGKPSIRQVVPARFSDPGKTELLFVVPPGGTTEADFALPAL